MKVINRSAITITYKKAFIDWCNYLFPDSPCEVGILGESKTYLINQIYDNAPKVIKKHYKEIFENELIGVCTDENEWPKVRSFKVFTTWFDYELSDWVFDLSNQKYFS